MNEGMCCLVCFLTLNEQCCVQMVAVLLKTSHSAELNVIILMSWLQGKVLTTREVGFFPSDAVKPCPCVSAAS